MTPLQQRMIEDIQLRGLSKRTQEAYVRAVRQLAEHYHTSPARITEEDLRQYFLYLKNVKHYSRSASTIALCGIKFFYEHTLKRQWSTLTFVRAPPREEAPGCPQCRRGAHHSGAPEAPALSGVPEHPVRLWSTPARGHPPAGPR